LFELIITTAKALSRSLANLFHANIINSSYYTKKSNKKGNFALLSDINPTQMCLHYCFINLSCTFKINRLCGVIGHTANR